MAETPVSLPEMKQQIRFNLRANHKPVKEFDPRAIRFVPDHNPFNDGLRRPNIAMNYDSCDPNDLANLNMANFDSQLEDRLCI